MSRSLAMAAMAAAEAPSQDGAAGLSHICDGSAVELCAHTTAHARMHDAVQAAMQLVTRLCDRGISERERSDCALRARGSLRLLDQMICELPGALAPVQFRRHPANSPREGA